ncbi:ribosome biogenesis protein NOP53 [Leptidea sinapis]|uniref:ribosome biogenesis protein NOP53 n=1 Tax=Leptidea sinapis TaxID=189913 RepID=UPI0021C276BB|nr:ribosome biogenesis protein NOP53 [Leptidea sinapis]
MIVEKKKKRVSKRNKTAWRKHSDIRDVEDFLEEQRLEERLGHIDKKTDDEIFKIDTIGDDVEEKPDVKPLSAKQQKRAKLVETPRCFEILLNSSKVEDPNRKRNHLKPVGSKPTDLSKLTTKRHIEKGTILKRLQLAKKDKRQAIQKKKKAKNVRQTYNKNLWGTDLPEAKGIPDTLVGDFTTTEAQLHNVPTTRRLRPKPPPPKIVVSRKAVELPHGGISYNPAFADHQELLQSVVQHEQKMMKKEEHLHRVTTKMFSRVTAKEKQMEWEEEMSVGLQPHKPQDDSEPSDNEYRAVNPPVKNKKKDHKARRKQREQILEKERRKREKIDKKKITDLYKLRKLQSSISKSEARGEVQRKKRTEKRQQHEKTALPNLNAHKTPAVEPDFLPPDQLSGDLRTVSTNTNLLRERFESLQRRGALAASKVMMKKKRRIKSYFKAGHKVTDADVQKYINKLDGTAKGK